VWLYVVPICVAAFIGMPHLQEIPALVTAAGSTIMTFTNERQYLITTVVKGIVMVAIALMIGAAAARSRKPEGFILALAIAAWIIALIQLGFILLMGVPLADMASPDARNFYEPLGMHANTLGRMHLTALALLLFVWADCKQPRMRLFLMLTLGVLAIALLLTFSRAAIGAAGLVGVLFLVWKFNFRSISLALLGVAFIAVVGGAAIWTRVTLGFGEGADAVSAGRSTASGCRSCRSSARAPCGATD
jgi:hypothetical protein